MKIKVISDSTCDLPASILEQYDITLVPLTIVKGTEEFADGVTITPADIFAHVAAGGSLCTTAAQSIGYFQEVFSRFAADYDYVIHINIGAEFSSSYQHACLAAQEFTNVKVVDSRNLSAGQGLLVVKACELAKNCTDIDRLLAQLTDYAPRIEASFVLDRLDYMVKGGRCSTATALGANLLNLKPSIEVRDGKMTVVKKYRGSYAKCLANYVKDRLYDRDDIDDSLLFFINTPVPEDCLEAAADAVAEYGRFQRIVKTVAGCTVSCHCGPGTLGIMFARK